MFARAIKIDHLLIDGSLLGRVHIRERIGNLAIHVLDRIQHAFAEKAITVSVAKFYGFVFPGGSAAGNDRPANRAARQV